MKWGSMNREEQRCEFARTVLAAILAKSGKMVGTSELVDCCWHVADAMMAEYDKRHPYKKPEPRPLPEGPREGGY